MAQFAIPALIGATATPAALSAAATPMLVGLTGLSAYQQVQAGKAQSAALKSQQREEEMAAKDRSIERRKRLIDALASQSVMAPVRGVAIGSPSLTAQVGRDVREAGFEQLTDEAMTSARRQNLGLQARNARRAGYIGAGASLLEGGYRAARAG